MGAQSMIYISLDRLGKALSGIAVVWVLGGCGGGGASQSEILGNDAPTAIALSVQAVGATDGPVAPQAVSMTKVSEARVSRTVYDYIYKVGFLNGNQRFTFVSASISTVGTGTSVVDGNIVVGSIEAGARVTPSDTITLRHDRTVPFNISALTWSITTTSQPATLQNIGIKSVRVKGPEDKLYVLLGSQLTASVVYELDSGVGANDLAWELIGDSSAVNMHRDGEKITVNIKADSAAADTSLPIQLKATNIKRGLHSVISAEAIIVPAKTLAEGNVGSAGGTIGVGASSATILPNSLPQAVHARLIEGTANDGSKRMQLQFAGDVKSFGLRVLLPPTPQPGLAEATPSKTIARGVKATSREKASSSSPLDANCGPSTLNPNPYSTPNSTIGAHDLAFTGPGLGTQLAYGLDKFVNPVTTATLPDIFNWGNSDFGYVSFRVKNSTIAISTQTADTGSFGGSTLPGSNGQIITTTIPFFEKPAYSLETALIPSNPKNCGASAVIKGYSSWDSHEPILFVHGFTPAGLGGGQGTWGKFPTLAAAAVIPSTKHLVPFEFHWNTNADFRGVAGELAAAINLIHSASGGKKVHIVAHSFGGVLSRIVLQGMASGIDPAASQSAIDNVASLVTLGSPHSGIFKEDSGVDLQSQSISFPRGQDSGFFRACPQISCREMGSEVSWLKSWAKEIGYSEDDSQVGGVLGQLSSSIGQLPNVPIFVGIGLSTTFGIVNPGDRLISFAGQRFENHANSDRARSAELLKNSKIGAATVTEVLLGFETRPMLRPGDSNPEPDNFLGRGNGYVHSSTSSFTNLLTTDGNSSIWANLIPGNFGLEAAPNLDCDAPTTCFHAGFKLFVRAMGAVYFNALSVGDHTLQQSGFMTLDVDDALTAKLAPSEIQTIRGILSDLQAGSFISGAQIRWDLVPYEKLAEFNRKLTPIFPTGRDPGEVEAVRSWQANGQQQLSLFTSKYINSQNILVTLDPEAALAFGQILLNGAQAAYAAVQFALPAATIAISNSKVFATKAVSPRTLAALRAIAKAGPWLDILKNCDIAADKHYDAINKQLALPPEQIDIYMLTDALKADVSCLASLFGKIDAKDSRKVADLVVALGSATVDYEGTPASAIVAITDFAAGVLDMFHVDPTTERISGLLHLVNEWADTYVIAAKLQQHVGEEVRIKQDIVIAVRDRLSKSLNEDYARQSVVARARGLFVLKKSGIATINSAPQSVSALDQVSLWITNAYEAVKSVVWSFGEGIATVVAKVVSGASEAINYVFTSAGNKTITVTYKDADAGLGSTMGTSAVTLSVSSSSVVSATAAITSIKTAAGIDIPDQGTTSETRLSLSGTLSAPISNYFSVWVYLDDARLAPATVDGTSWTYTTAGDIPVGAHKFTVGVVRFDGVEGSASVARRLTVVNEVGAGDLSANFSSSKNPNGQWSYGWISPAPDAQFQAFDKPEQYTNVPPLFYDAANANLRYWTAGTPYSLFVAANIGSTPLVFRGVPWQGNSVWQHPGRNGEMAVSRWIAPKSGTFKINAAFSLLENGSVDVRILKNGLPLFSDYLSSSKMATSNSTMGNVDIAAGDKLDFVVGYGGDNYLADETMVSVSITPATPTSSGLVGYWSFDDCTAADNSGNGGNGQLKGSPVCEQGVAGSGMKLNSTNWIDVPSRPSLEFTNSFTISVWFKAEALTDERSVRLVDKTAAGVNDGYLLSVWASGLSLIGGGPFGVVSNPIPITNNVYHHAVVTFGNGIASFYLDGVPIGSRPVGAMSMFVNPNRGLRIGAAQGPDAHPTLNNFVGVIDEVRLYNTTLASSDVSGLYQATSNSVKLNAANGHRYEIINCGTWTQCRDAAIAKGGNLVTVRSQAENDWLVTNVLTTASMQLGAWIGLERNSSGTWVTNDGKIASYFNWSAGNPNNSGGDELFGMIYSAPSALGYWNDANINGSGMVNQAIVEYIQLSSIKPLTSGLPGTGITEIQCYRGGSNVLVNCASAEALALFDKQDGMLQSGSAGTIYALVKKASGGSYDKTECVQDNKTGLVWEGKAADSGFRGLRERYTNQNSGQSNDTSGYVNAVNAIQLCGRSDWRLPTASELQLIVNYGATGGVASIENTWFPNTPLAPHWTTSALQGRNPPISMFVDFRTGDVGGLLRNALAAVRLVSGSAGSEPVFQVSADGSEAKDLRSGLVWRRCIEGSNWNGASCVNAGAATYTHEAAFARAIAQRTSDKQWRLPNVKELTSLVRRDGAEPLPYIENSVFPGTPNSYFWTTSPFVSDSSIAWTVYFGYGSTGSNQARVEPRYVRLVRNE